MRRLGLRARLIASVMGAVLLVGIVTAIVVQIRMTDILEAELEQHGLAVARDVAIRSADPILTLDTLLLQDILDDALRNTPDMRYAAISDRSGRVLSTTFPRGVPRDLLPILTTSPSGDFHVELLKTEEGLIRDISVPIYRGKAGVVHVGLSERALSQTLDDMIRWLIGLTLGALLLGVLAAYILATLTTRPLRRLARGLHELGRGKLGATIALDGDDELGKLGRAFNDMSVALRRSQRELESTIDVLSDGFMTMDPQMRVVALNPSAEALLGWKTAEVVGRRCGELIGCLNDQGDCTRPGGCLGCGLTVNAGRGPVSKNFPIRRRDGSVVLCQVNAAVIRDEADVVIGFIHTFRDITQEEGMRQDILRRNRELSALNAVASAVGGSLDLRTTLQTALAAVLEVIGVEAGGILLWDEDGSLSYHARQGLSQTFVDGIAGLMPGEGIAGRVAATGEPVVIPDISVDPRVTRRVVFEEGIRSFASVPLRAQDKVVGVMNVTTHRLRPFTPDEVTLLVSIGNQIGVAVDNSRLWQELKQKEELHSQLLQKVITAQEEERKRIARELHDETSQALTSVMVGLRVLSAARDGTEARRQADDLRDLVGGVLEAVHDMALELRPSILDDMGLTAALQRYVREYAQKHDLQVDFQTGGVEGLRLEPEVETAVYRIVQEALTNVARHAHASNVSILIERRRGELVVVVEDDGRGFDLPAVAASPAAERHLGLDGMRERAALIGGALRLESEPGAGTSVYLDLPVEVPAVEAEAK